MASAIVNNPDPPPSAPAFSTSSYGWLSPRISFSCDFSDEDNPPTPPVKPPASPGRAAEDADLDFEFRRVDDPAAMLPADELFADGMLLPREVATARLPAPPPSAAAVRSPTPEKKPVPDPYGAFSPKAPTCTGRWRELLRLRRAAQSSAAATGKCPSSSSGAAAASSGGAAARSLRHLLQRNPRCSASDSAPIPSRPRRSLDADKPGGEASASVAGNPARLRVASRAGRPATRRAAGAAGARSASVDSPRVNSSGKVVFQGLGRSSSSPSALHGGARGRHHPAGGAVVRVAPVLNVAVCSLRGSAAARSSSSAGSSSVFGLFSAPQRKESAAGSSNSGATKSGGGGGGGKTERAWWEI